MIIRNVRVFMPDGKFAKKVIGVNRDKIFSVCEDDPVLSDDVIIDGQGCYAIPGMIDMHFHGCNGWDFCDGTMEAMDEIASYEASIGVTTICPATMTLSVEELERVLLAASEYKKMQKELQGRASLAGINMEGPFISAKKRGAQDERYILPCNAEVFQKFREASGGLVKVIGIAPEEGDPLPFIQAVKDKVIVSLAHSNADYMTAKLAMEAGASHVVHLYNAMSAFTHREPGIVGAAADCGDVTAELICDGIHVHPAVVRSTFRMFGEDRLILISDSMRATGLEDGTYTLGGLEVAVHGNRAVMVRDGALAGSVTPLPDCLRIAVKEMGIPLETAVRAATINPAKRLGIFEDCGSIEPGKAADIVLLDEDIAVRKVIKSGKIVD